MAEPETVISEVIPFDTRYAVVERMSLAQSRAYCRSIAASRYENFLVGTILLPRGLRKHFDCVYAYCRVADDLADESPNPKRALQLLDWWESELDRAKAGNPRHPVFIALADTMAAFGLPDTPFRDLLSAFRQDQTVTRYRSYDELLDYCRRSANPVGRIVLHLFGFTDETRRSLSDSTCTALQLANFIQDVTGDFERGRVYLPQADLQRFGVTEEQIGAREFTSGFARLIELECRRAYELFEHGRTLADVVPRRLRMDVEMFTMGGLEILRRIERQGYDVLTSRPAIPKARQATIFMSRLIRSILP